MEPAGYLCCGPIPAHRCGKLPSFPALGDSAARPAANPVPTPYSACAQASNSGLTRA